MLLRDLAVVLLRPLLHVAKIRLLQGSRVGVGRSRRIEHRPDKIVVQRLIHHTVAVAPTGRGIVAPQRVEPNRRLLHALVTIQPVEEQPLVVRDEEVIGIVLRLGLPCDSVEHRLLASQMALRDAVVERPQMLEGAAVGGLLRTDMLRKCEKSQQDGHCQSCLPVMSAVCHTVAVCR